MRENSKGAVSASRTQALEQDNVVCKSTAFEKFGIATLRILKGRSFVCAIQSNENEFFLKMIDDVTDKVDKACTELSLFHNNLLEGFERLTFDQVHQRLIHGPSHARHTQFIVRRGSCRSFGSLASGHLGFDNETQQTHALKSFDMTHYLGSFPSKHRAHDDAKHFVLDGKCD
jgi:hypothetical protein